jgi:hypothetical protein
MIWSGEMRITTETAIGHIIFKTVAQAEAFVTDAAEFADAGETFKIEPFQGGRFHVARYFNDAFEAWC